MLGLGIYQFHANDPIVTKTIGLVLNAGHDKKIKTRTLTFYRNAYLTKRFIEKKGNIIFLVGLINHDPIAVSACAIGKKSQYTMHSFTIVHPSFRNLSVGSLMLQAKLALLEKYHPEATIKFFISKTNEAAIKLCKGVDLRIVGEGTREREDRDPTHFFIFSDEELELEELEDNEAI